MLVLNLATFSQRSTESDTSGAGLNGWGWDTLSRLEKSQYVSGLYEGVWSLGEELNLSLPDQQKVISEKVLAYLTRQRLADLILQVDSFYQDRANVKIPVSDVVQWVAAKNNGKSDKELDNLLVKFRRKWNR